MGLLRHHVRPSLGGVQVRAISKTDVAKFHASMHATPVAANRALGLVSAMLAWAERIGERSDGSNPCRHVHSYPEKGRERLLSVEELAGSARHWLPPLLHGQRRGRPHAVRSAGARPRSLSCRRQSRQLGSKPACQSVAAPKTSVQSPFGGC